ncbi:hypothetical protein [Adlercreutzia equolifaciens]|uniref:hypothetical protein n=1 Tax=Adlercreutzia equolifaciens TaxID=446660 RepID=UPI0022E60605|nr:hypothetical protein [Adlercreutzia equolifaciens]
MAFVRGGLEGRPRGGHGSVAYRLKSATGEFGYRVSAEGGRKETVELAEKRVATWSPKLARVFSIAL